MRLDEIQKLARRRRLDTVLVCGQANIRALTGVNCDNAILNFSTFPPFRFSTSLYTDFRYIPMVHRVAPDLKCRDLKAFKITGRRIGYESSIAHAKFIQFQKLAPRGAKFVDVADDLLAIRAVKTPRRSRRSARRRRSRARSGTRRPRSSAPA